MVTMSLGYPFFSFWFITTYLLLVSLIRFPKILLRLYKLRERWEPT